MTDVPGCKKYKREAYYPRGKPWKCCFQNRRTDILSCSWAETEEKARAQAHRKAARRPPVEMPEFWFR